MGKVTVVGIGPGNDANMTFLADRAIRECQVLAGYTVYVNLVKDRYPGKEIITTPMTGEARRCRMALSAAREGKRVAMVCSGDSGVYGMAGLLYELRGTDREPEIEVIPGLTAALSGGALLGAPLTHDFCVLSLSNRLTPWELIEKRLDAAVSGDYALVLYNPASGARPDTLRLACQRLLKRLPADRPCGIVRNVGREGESWELLTLERLRDYPADMFCTAFVGNSTTQIIGGKLVTPRGYPNV